MNSTLGQNNGGNKGSSSLGSERSIQSHVAQLASDQQKHPAKIVTNSITARYEILCLNCIRKLFFCLIQWLIVGAQPNFLFNMFLFSEKLCHVIILPAKSADQLFLNPEFHWSIHQKRLIDMSNIICIL